MRPALGFLTPLGGARRPSARALPWFPLVGAALGIAVGLVWWGAAQWWPLPIAAALAVIADLALTGMLHVDGLSDAADGLLPPLTRERRLEVMRDPRAGAFGVVTVVSILLLRFAVFATVIPEPRTALVVGGVWAAARGVMAIATCVVPYARTEGLASAFVGSSPTAVIIITVVVAFGLAAAGADPAVRGVLAVAGCAIAATAVIAFARSRLGGFTGDVLGACGLIGETAGLLLLAVHG